MSSQNLPPLTRNLLAMGYAAEQIQLNLPGVLLLKLDDVRKSGAELDRDYHQLVVLLGQLDRADRLYIDAVNGLIIARQAPWSNFMQAMLDAFDEDHPVLEEKQNFALFCGKTKALRYYSVAGSESDFEQLMEVVEHYLIERGRAEMEAIQRFSQATRCPNFREQAIKLKVGKQAA